MESGRSILTPSPFKVDLWQLTTHCAQPGCGARASNGACDPLRPALGSFQCSHWVPVGNERWLSCPGREAPCLLRAHMWQGRGVLVLTTEMKEGLLCGARMFCG